MKRNLRKALALASAILVGGIVGSASAAGTAAGTAIDNTAYLDLNDGTSSSTLSSTVRINVTQLAGVSITPNGADTSTPGQTVLGTPGQTANTTYTVCNTGNGTDSINLTAGTGQTSGVSYYLETGTTAGYSADDTLVTSLSNLAADACRTVYAVYAIPAGTADTVNIYTNPTGTSAFNSATSDSGNVGLIDVIRVIDMTLSPSDTGKTLPGTGSYTFATATLQNTGNTILTAADVAVTTTIGGTASGTILYTVVGPGGTFTGTDQATLNTAIDSAIGSGLAITGAGSSLTITTKVTTAGAADQSTWSGVIQAYSPTSASSSVVNNAPTTDTTAQITDSGTVARGVGSVTKQIASCTGSTFSTCGSYGAGPIDRQPGQYAAYELVASNTGTGSLFNIKLSDALPNNYQLTNFSVTPSGVSGTVLYSTDGSSWSSTAPAASSLTSGTRLYVGVDTNSDGSISLADSFPASAKLTMNLIGYVK